jgi:hypothetical protein
MYLEFLTQLNVEYSKPKTHISPIFFEFAKRLFLEGQEVTPFPISALKEDSKRFYSFINLLQDWSKRGYTFKDNLASGLKLYHSIVEHKPSRFTSKLFNSAYLYDMILTCIKSIPSGEAAIHMNSYATALGYTLNPPISEKECISILSNIAVDSFAKSNPLEVNPKRKSVGLGPMAINLVQRISEYYYSMSFEVCQEIIESIPVLGVYAGIEENSMALLRKSVTFSD